MSWVKNKRIFYSCGIAVKIAAKKAGTTTVTITDSYGKNYTCKVAVKPTKRQKRWCKQGKHVCTKGNKCDWCGTKVK